MVMRKGDEINLAFRSREETLKRIIAFVVPGTVQLKSGRGCAKERAGRRNCFTNEISLASRNRESSLHTPAHLCRLARCALPNS